MPLVVPQLRHTALIRELGELALRLQDTDTELEVTRLARVPEPEEPQRGPSTSPWPEVPDLVAEDLATFALDVAQERGASGVLNAVADAADGFVPGADQAVVTLLLGDEVELSAATGSASGSCEAWQLAVGDGPAATATAVPGTVVVVDDLATDPRWVDLHAVVARDGLPSVMSVAAALPTSSRTLLISWYGKRADAFSAPDCARVALLTTAHACVALDRALREDELQAEILRIDDQLG